jgi:hypothetical protein
MTEMGISTKKTKEVIPVKVYSITNSRYNVKDRVLPDIEPRPPGKPRSAYGKPVKFPGLSEKDLEWVKTSEEVIAARQAYERAVLYIASAFCRLNRLDASILLGFAVASLDSSNGFLNAFIVDVLKRKIRAWLNDNYRAGLFNAVGVASYHTDFARGKASNIFVKNNSMFKGNLTRYLG